MGITNSTPISAPDTLPPFNSIPGGKTRICVVAFKSFNFVAGHGAFILSGRIAKKFPDLYETWYYTPNSTEYYEFLKVKFDPVPFPDHLKGHQTSPFVWLETSTASGENKITPIGGGDRFRDWVTENQSLSNLPEIMEWINLGTFGVFGTEISENQEGWEPATADTSSK